MATDVDKPKSKRSITRLFRNEGSDEPTSRATESTTHILFRFADGEETEFDLAKAFGGSLPPKGVGRAAAAFGISTSAGNAGNTAAHQKDTDDPEVAREAVEARLETLVPPDGSPGEWSAGPAEGGPRTSLLLEAVIAYRIANGRPVDDAAMKPILAQLHNPDKDAAKAYAKKLGEVPQVEAELQKIKAKRAADRAAKAAASAQGQAHADELLN